MSEFLVLARPRSRSGWFANLLTQPPASLCLHEELPVCRGSVAQLKARLRHVKREAGVQAIGCADTGLIHNLEEIDEHFPEARCCLIIGDDRRWHRFANRLDLSSDIVRAVDSAYASALTWAEGSARTMKLHVTGMEYPGVMEGAWQFLTGAGGFNFSRHDLLRRLYVYQPADEIRQRAHPDFAGVLSSIPIPDDRPRP